MRRRRRPQLPSGTVTFCFTDLEGSTRLLQTLGDGYGAVLEQHRAVVRSVIDGQDAVEHGTEGDSFFLVFQSADVAVQSALRIHRELAAHPWPPGAPLRVRIGLDTDVAYPLGGDYIAMGIHRAARIQAAAHGGQTLVSRHTLDQLSLVVRDVLTSTALGSFRLKDIAEPVHLVDVADRAWPTGPPAPRAAVAFRSRLPRPRDSFLGRDSDLAEVQRLLARNPVVTLTGPGGSGKTRLAVEVAHRVSAELDGPAWFVDLSGVDDAAGVTAAVATTLSLRQDVEAATALGIAEHLEPTAGLLVLDNCEHVLDPVAELVEELIAVAMQLQVLCTSRWPLGVQAEQRWAVKPLVLQAAPYAGEDSLSPAAALFLDRARRVDPGLVLTTAGAASVARVCAQLDGLPLALELAAARLASVPLAELPRLLETQLDTLSTEDRRRGSRHGTLAAVLESSVAGLTTDQRAALARLSVFRGGAGLEAVARIVTDGDEVRARRVIEDLARRSLVEVDFAQDSVTGQTRFRLLETIRFHAATLVSDPGALAQAHAEWVLDEARRVDAAHGTSEQPQWTDRLLLELANVRAAFAWLSAVETEQALALANLLAASLVSMGQGASARAMLTEALGKAFPTTPAEAKAQITLGRHLTLHVRLGGEGLALLRAGLATAEALGDEETVLEATLALAGEAREASREGEASTLLRSAMATARRLGRVDAEAFAMALLGVLVSEQGDDEQGVLLTSTARDLARAHDEERVSAIAAHALSVAAWAAEDLGTARAAAEEGLKSFTALGDRWGAMLCLAALSCAERADGHLAWAALHLDEAFDLMEELGSRTVTPQLVLYSAVIAARAGEIRVAAELIAAAAQLRDEQGETATRHERTCEAEAAIRIATLAEGEAPAEHTPDEWILLARRTLRPLASQIEGFAPKINP